MIPIETQFEIALDKADKENAYVFFICARQIMDYLKRFVKDREGVYKQHTRTWQSRGVLRMVDVTTSEDAYQLFAGSQMTHVFVAKPIEDDALSFLHSLIRSATYTGGDMGIYLPDGCRYFLQYDAEEDKYRTVKEKY